VILLTLPPQPRLRTARLWLTPFTVGDAAAVFEYASDPEVARYVTFRPHRSVADAEAFIRSVATQRDTHVWALREAGGGDARGPALGAVEFSLDAPGLGSVHYVLARPLWGQGLATEVLRAVLHWAFAALPELRQIRTTAAEANIASRRVLEKCGFRPLGVHQAPWEKLAEPIALRDYELGRETWLGNAPT